MLFKSSSALYGYFYTGGVLLTLQKKLEDKPKKQTKKKQNNITKNNRNKHTKKPKQKAQET